MQKIEFDTVLHQGEAVIHIPSALKASIPTEDSLHVVVYVGENQEEKEWRRSTREHFLRDDSPEDAFYDHY